MLFLRMLVLHDMLARPSESRVLDPRTRRVHSVANMSISLLFSSDVLLDENATEIDFFIFFFKP